MKGHFDQTDLKALIARELERGYVTHDDIRAFVQESAKSDQMLAKKNEEFNRGVGAAFPENDCGS